MQNDNIVADPLKPFDEITSPDVRQKNLSGTLEGKHEVLSNIYLHSGVPLEVRQSFETAKNVSLYTWFVYRFHQVSELIAFVTLEMALRTRFNLEWPDKKSPNLAELLRLANKNKWIENERFFSLRATAKQHAWEIKNFKLADEHNFDLEPEMTCAEPDEAEIAEALAEIDLAAGVTNTANKLRNNLAHGSTTLHPHSISTLRIVSEVINQLFEHP